jgi:hypothetical protein
MNPRQKAKDLIELASDIHTSDKERLSAAIKAVQLIRKHDLLASPLDGLLDNHDETIRAATNVFQTLTDPTLVGNLKKVAGRFNRRRRPR